MESIIVLLSLYFGTFLFALLRETTFSMVFSLILVFSVACILVFNLKFYFLGFMILIIYLGAIAVLFLFMVMLFDRTEYKIFVLEKSNNNNNKFLIAFLLCLSLFLSFLICYFVNGFSSENIVYSNNDINELQSSILVLNESKNIFHDNISIFLGSNNATETFNSYSNFSDAELIGFELYIKYFFLLIICALGLLVAMIGCIIITKSSFLDKFERRNQSIERQLSRFKI